MNQNLQLHTDHIRKSQNGNKHTFSALHILLAALLYQVTVPLCQSIKNHKQSHAQEKCKSKQGVNSKYITNVFYMKKSI